MPEPEGLDHVVLLGATCSVYSDGPNAGWIAEELAWLRQADEAGVPVFGICFGAQMLAATFGGRVGPAARKEIGWTVVNTLDPALIPAGPWLEFRGDQCYPPPRARLLARNALGVQAFAVGRHLAVQFHPEVNEAQLRGWLSQPAGGPRPSGPGSIQTGSWPRRPPRSRPPATAPSGWSRRRSAWPPPELTGELSQAARRTGP